MKIQYEKGDLVYLSSDYGGFVYEINAVYKLGVRLKDRDTGETFYAGKRQIEPHPNTAVWATWLTEEVK